MHNTATLTSVTAKIAGAQLILHPYKAVFYPEASALIISDAHLGKADHFRKSGIAVPQEVNITNLNRLKVLIETYLPSRVIFLGDLFHSSLNAAWEDFINSISYFPKCFLKSI